MRSGIGSTTPLTLTADAQLMQDYLETAGILVNSGGAPAIATLQNADGESEAIALDADGNVCHVCREPLSDSGWNMFGIGAGLGAIGAVDAASVWALSRVDGSVWQGSHGRWTRVPGALTSGQAPIEISVGTDGAVWTIDTSGAVYAKGASTTQDAPTPDAAVAPVTIRDAGGALHVLVVDSSGNLWTIAQDAPGGGWGFWTSLGAPAGVSLAAIAAAPTPDTGLAVTALAEGGGAVWCIGEPGPGQPWSAWIPIGAPSGASLGTIAFALDAAGQATVLASDSTGQVWSNAGPVLGGAWTGWQSLGSPGLGAGVRLAVAAAPNGALALFAGGTGAEPVASIAQTGPGGEWGQWSSLGGNWTAGTVAALATALNQNGCTDVFVGYAQTEFSHVAEFWHWMQEAPTATSGVWNALPAPSVFDLFQAGVLAVAQNADGRLELFVAGASPVLWHCWQEVPGGGWASWASLATPGGSVLGQIAVARDRAGRLNAFGLDASSAFSQIQQMPTNTGWGSWVTGWWAWCDLGAPAPIGHAPSGTGSDFWAVTASGSVERWSAGAWTTVAAPPSAQASFVALGAGGIAWALATDGVLYQWVNGAWEALPGNLAGVASFAASDATGLWATAAPDAGAPQDYALFRYDAGAWQAVPTTPLHGGWNPPQVSVASDASVWTLDGSGAVWRMEARRPVQWTARGVPAGAGHVASLTAAPGGAAWAVDGAGGIWNYRGSWARFPAALPGGAEARQVAAGAGGTLWAIDTAGNPYAYAAASAAWQPVSGLPALTVAPTTWALGVNGTIWQYGDGAWTQLMHSLPDSIWPAQVAAAADGSVWALDIHGGLYQYPATAGAWEPVMGAPAGLVQVAVVDASAMWAIAQANPGALALYYYVDGGWQRVAGAPLMSALTTAPQVSVGPDGTVWMLDGNGLVRTVSWNPAASSWAQRPAGTGLLALAATGVDRARAVAVDGSFRQNFANRWVDPGTPLPLGVPAASVSIGSDGTAWALDDAGVLYAQSAPVAPAPPIFPEACSPAACLDALGRLQLFASDTQGTLWTCRQGGVDGWQGWLSLGAPAGASAAGAVAALDALGRTHAFAIAGAAGALWQRRQTAPGGGWGPWDSMGAPSGVTLASLAVGPNPDGRLQIFAVGADGNLYTVWETAPGAWSSWGVLSPGTPSLSSASAILRPDGNLEIVAVGNDGAVHAVAQTAPNDGWGPWMSLGTPAGIQIEGASVGPNANGLLQIFAAGSDQGLYTTWETAPGVWGAWGPLIDPATSVPVRSVSAALDAQGLLHVLALGADQAVHHSSQTAPSNGWGPWTTVGTPTGSAPTTPLIVPGATGALAAFTIAAGTAGAWAIEQDASADGWSTWVPLGMAERLLWSAVPGAPVLVEPPRGLAGDCWALDTGGTVVNWNGQQWIAAPLPGGAAAAGVSAGADGSIWAVDAGAGGQPRTCYRYVNGGWLETGRGDFAQAPEGSATDLWCPTAGGAIRRSADGGATWWEDDGLAVTVARVTAALDGTVWALDARGTAWICAAWARTMRPTGMSGWPDAIGTAVAAGQDSRGVRYVFFTSATGAFAYSFEVFRHTWVEPVEIAQSGVSNPGVASQQDTGALIAYGISGSSLVVATETQDVGFYLAASQVTTVAWNPNQTWLMNLAGVELCAVDAGTWYWFGLATTGVGANCLVVARATAQDGTATFAAVWNSQTGDFPSGFAAIVRLPWPRSAQTPYALVVDGSGNLQILSVDPRSIGQEYLPCAVLALTGPTTALATGVTAAAALWQAGAGTPQAQRLYAAAPVGGEGPAVVWLLRLVDASSPVTAPGAWSAWIPLGGNYLSLASGPAGLRASTLFGTSGSDTSLASLSQDPVTGTWTAREVTRPSQSGDAIEPVSMYHTLITLTDATGTLAQPGVPVTITADSPVAIWTPDGVHAVDSSHGITCPTDASGALRIRTLANGLHTPQLTFAADGLPAGQSVYPPQHVHDFLAGSGQLAVGGGLPASFSAGTLTGATVGGQPLSPNLSPDTAQHVVTVAGQIAQLPGGPSAPGSGPAGWIVVDRSDRSRPVIRAFSDATSFHAHRRALHARRPRLLGWSISDLGDDIKHGLEDAAQAAESGVMDVEDFAVDTTTKVVSFTLSVAGEIVAAIDMVVNTVADALRAIEILLATLIADIEMIIEWLQLLFQWEDIWKTKEAIEQFLGQALAILGGEIGTVRAGIPSLVSALEDSLTAAVDGLIETLGSSSFQYKTFGNLPSSPSSPDPGRRPPMAAPGSLPSLPGTSPVQLGWLLAKTLGNITPGFDLGSPGPIDFASLLQAIDSSNVLGAIEQAAADLATYVTDAIAHPSSFAQLSLATFLGAGRDLIAAVLGGLQDLLEALLDVVQQVLAGIAGIFDHRLDIPGISSLYQFVTGLLGHSENLTVGHLCALLIAVPLTITSKLLNGGQTPYSGLGLEADGTPGPGPRLGAGPADAWQTAYVCTGLSFVLPVVALLDGISIAKGPGAKGDPVSALLGALADVAAMVQQINSWPGTFPTPPDPQGAVALWKTGNWAVYWFAILMDLGMIVNLAREPSDEVASAKNIIRFAFGNLALATAAVTVGLARAANPPALSGDGIALEVVKPLPLWLAWMMVEPLPPIRASIEAATVVDPAWLKLVADALCNLALPYLYEFA